MLFKGNLVQNVLEGSDKIEWLKIKGQDGTADRPSGLVLQANAAGVMTDYYIWIDRNGNLRYHTSKPTDEDANGTIIAGSSTAGASKALDNLASVAIATDLNLTDSVAVTFGASQDYNIEYDGSDLLIDPAAANDRILIGGTTVSDIQITGAASEVTWDGSADTLTVMDSGILAFGDADDVTITWNATSLELNMAAANGMFNIGATVNTDVTFHGGTAGSDVTWDASADTFSFLDAVKCAFGDSDDVYLTYNASNYLSFLQTVAGTGYVCFGVDDTGMDVKFFGATAGDYVLWDESADTLVFEDAKLRIDGANVTYTYAISTDALQITATDHANASYVFGTNGTNGMNVTFNGQASGDTVVFDAGAGTWTYTDIQQVVTGADSSGTLLAITGIDTTGNSDTVTIAHSGSGAGLQITCSEADSQALELIGCASQTTWIGYVDGATNNWSGADNIGMFHIVSDATFAHAGATQLAVIGSGKPVAAAQGFLARFVDTGTATASTYAVEIDSTNNNALHIVTGAAGVSNLVMDGLQAQTASICKIDGSTGTGWDGADNVGMLHLVSDSTHVHAGATMLYVGNSAQSIASAEGTLARFLNTGTARAGATMVEIAAKDATEYGLKVTAGQSLFTHAVTCSAGVQAAAVSRTPTVDGTGTGLIADGTTMVAVTSGADANCWLTLPTPTPGNVVWLLTSGDAAGFEVRSSTPASVAINGGSGANAESAIGATATMVRFVCVSATEWIASWWDADGDEAKVEAAA